MCNKTARRILACIAALLCTLAHAETARIAVAANFAAPAKALAQMLNRNTGHTARLSFGASGVFTAQIENGAPFDVLLAADAQSIDWLQAKGLAVPGSRLTYAVGRLALWSATPGLVDDQGKVLGSGRFGKLAIANPKLAPYGAAAWQTLEKLGLAEQLRPKLVMGESIGQTYQFVASGNAALGFVALSQVMEGGKPVAGGSPWIVPESLHAPIVQDAALLKRGANNPAARAWMALLESTAAQDVMRGYGYAAPKR
ncbi:MAG: molybdate ABC transporter substrate-binding protein [Burkholderiaceae bacterium]|jgi:molybdate transport system substrate-binding protein|nr:molybdate ABC transporter substrate-binding protein [Burkholderiaceae bacterium]